LRVLGYAKGDVIGKTSAELGMFVHAEQQAAIADRLQAEGRVADCELAFRCKDGTVLESLFSGEVIESQGQPYFLTVMIDITARTKAEDLIKSVHRRLLGVREEEGRRIAEELHESVCQDLAALRISLMILGKNSDIAGAAGVGSKIGTAADICLTTMNNIRDICYAVYPPSLQTLGLVAALHSLEKTGERLGARVQIHCEASLATVRLPHTLEVALFRVAQEALVNATRHGKAQSVSIMMQPHDGGLLVRVTDDGAGFDADRVVAGLGLTVMRERMLAIGGVLKIASSPGHTTVTAIVPKYSEFGTGGDDALADKSEGNQ
jgi:PAS domain S-box-containing protein